MYGAVMPSRVGKRGKWEAASEERESWIVRSVREGECLVREFPSSQGGDPVRPHPPEHLDKRALKEPVFSSSWRHMAKESPNYLNFSPVPPHLL